jgi:hypothetical protein
LLVLEINRVSYLLGNDGLTLEITGVFGWGDLLLP